MGNFYEILSSKWNNFKLILGNFKVDFSKCFDQNYTSETETNFKKRKWQKLEQLMGNTKAAAKRLSLNFGFPNNATYRQFNKAVIKFSSLETDRELNKAFSFIRENGHS